MVKKKRRQALLDVLVKEKDLKKSVAEWKSEPTQPAETVREPPAAKMPVSPISGIERRVDEIRLTYPQAGVVGAAVVILLVASFLIGKQFGTIELPATKDKRPLEKIRGEPPEPGLLPAVRQVTPPRVEPPRPAPVRPPEPPTEGRYRLRIITLPAGGQAEQFQKFLAENGIETVTETMRGQVIIFSKARFAARNSPEAQGFRTKVVDLGPAYSVIGGPTNLNSSYFEQVPEE